MANGSFLIRQRQQWQLIDSGREILPQAREVLLRVGDIETVGQTAGPLSTFISEPV